MPRIARLIELVRDAISTAEKIPLKERIELVNTLRSVIRSISPFGDHPVEHVYWVPVENVRGNPYNPNKVAPPEMRLLELSIAQDGFTQPIVVSQQGQDRLVIVDGFHRHTIANTKLKSRLLGHVPVVNIREGCDAKSHRMAATIRHNRARGVHEVILMKDVVVALIRDGKSDEQILKELGMDRDELMRFKQVSGLPELFRDCTYNPSWE